MCFGRALLFNRAGRSRKKTRLWRLRENRNPGAVLTQQPNLNMKVKQTPSKYSRAAAAYVSPGRKPWGKRQSKTSPVGTAQIHAQALRLRFTMALLRYGEMLDQEKMRG